MPRLPVFLLLLAILPLAAGDSLVAGGFDRRDAYAGLAADPLAHGALPRGWRDNSTWSKADCTYAFAEEGATGFLHASGAASGRLQISHPFPALAERAAFRVTLRARSAGRATVRLAIYELAAPYRTLAATSIALGADWQEETRIIAGGPGAGALGFLLSAPSPATCDVASLRVEPALLADYRPTTLIPVMRTDRDWYPKRHQELIIQLAARQPAVVVLGDSLTAAWEKEGAGAWAASLAPLSAMQAGIGGDRVEHLAWRLRNSGIGTAFTPKVAVILIGVNNLASDNPDDIAAGTAALLDHLRSASPGTRILLLGLLPTGEKPDHPNRAAVAAINARYAGLARERGIAYADLGGGLLEADGTLARATAFDGLHLTAAGYRIYAGQLVPEIRRLLAP